MNKRLITGLLALQSMLAFAACPSWPTAERFTVNGAEVADTRTGLTWKRCSEGQTWSGSTCTGTATIHNHEAALALAKQANSSTSATGWRLPHEKELASLADKGCPKPAIDITAFPATPNGWFWSSSPDASNTGGPWHIYLVGGSYGDHSLRIYGKYAVRLVRDSQ
jgi:hypothetical protein